jgi:hypothetical protein
VLISCFLDSNAFLVNFLKNAKSPREYLNLI